MKVAFGTDHAATMEARAEIMEYLKELGHEVTDFGYAGEGPKDYPIYAQKVAEAVTGGQADCGVLVCGTGIGMSIAANKVDGIRCAVCADPYSAEKAREHNNANIIALGVRTQGMELIKTNLKAYFSAQYNPKYDPRIEMIANLEKN